VIYLPPCWGVYTPLKFCGHPPRPCTPNGGVHFQIRDVRHLLNNEKTRTGSPALGKLG